MNNEVGTVDYYKDWLYAAETANAALETEILRLQGIVKQVEAVKEGSSPEFARFFDEASKSPVYWTEVADLLREELNISQTANTALEKRVKDLEGERDKLNAVRLAALHEVAIHCNAIPESHLENGRLEHAFVLAAHRILATGEPDGILKTQGQNLQDSAPPSGSQPK